MAGEMTPAQLVAELRPLANGQELTKEVRRALSRIGGRAANDARAEMRASGDRQLARAADTVRGSATNTAARVRVGGRAVPFALAAVWGKKGPTGWYAGWYTPTTKHGTKGQKRLDPQRRRGFARAAMLYPNNPRWIGQDWTVADPSGGPRGLNRALNRNQRVYQGEIVTELDRITARAFPVGRL
jgi:hypothetical protein